MATHFPINFTAQLRQHLKALRKSRQLTQAQLGDLLGISQARVAEIEANPGLVKFEQLMQLLSALNVTMLLSADPPAPQQALVSGANVPVRRGAPDMVARQDMQTWPGMQQSVPTQPLSPAGASTVPQPDGTAHPASQHHPLMRPKKGSW